MDTAPFEAAMAIRHNGRGPACSGPHPVLRLLLYIPGSLFRRLPQDRNLAVHFGLRIDRTSPVAAAWISGFVRGAVPFPHSADGKSYAYRQRRSCFLRRGTWPISCGYAISEFQTSKLESARFRVAWDGVRSEVIKSRALAATMSGEAVLILGSGATRPGEVAVRKGSDLVIRALIDELDLNSELGTTWAIGFLAGAAPLPPEEDELEVSWRGSVKRFRATGRWPVSTAYRWWASCK